MIDDSTPLQEYIQDFASMLANENITLIKQHCGDPKRDVVPDILKTFLYYYVHKILTDVLHKNHGKSLSNKAIYEKVRKEFASVKLDIQEAIANAFSDAATKFSGEYVDYMCTIDPMPEPINERPC